MTRSETFVVDASVAISWTFADERTPEILDAFARVVRYGATAPGIWPLEVANGMRTAMRKGRCDEAFVTRSLWRLQRLVIEIDDETNIHAWRKTRELSRDHGLTCYDAAYLELALRHWSGLATTDVALREAVRRCDVELVG